jgi:hypothetical protein
MKRLLILTLIALVSCQEQKKEPHKTDYRIKTDGNYISVGATAIRDFLFKNENPYINVLSIIIFFILIASIANLFFPKNKRK